MVVAVQELMNIGGHDKVDECMNGTLFNWDDTNLRNGLRRAVLSKPKNSARTYTMVAGGSSVTAGGQLFNIFLYGQGSVFYTHRNRVVLFESMYDSDV